MKLRSSSSLLAAVVLAGCAPKKPDVGQQTQFECTDPSQVAVSKIDNPPPAISGGTLVVTKDGLTAVAADSDRDQVYVVDVPSFTTRFTVALNAGDEPGRVVEDASGQIHVALRRGGAVATIDPVKGVVVARRAVCAAPRGLAFDSARGLMHVACAGGELISYDPRSPRVVRSLKLEADLRDVIVRGSSLVVSKFRTAELLTVDSSGQVLRVTPSHFSAPDVRHGDDFAPAVAWRTIPFGNQVLMVHQRGTTATIATAPPKTDPSGSAIGGPNMQASTTPFPGDPSINGGPIGEPGPPGGGVVGGGGDDGYGNNGGGGGMFPGGPPNPCGAISHATVSVLSPADANDAGGAVIGAALDSRVVLPVDIAADPTMQRVAVIAAGFIDPTQFNSSNENVFLLDATQLQQGQSGCAAFNGMLNITFNVPQPVAVAFAGSLLIVQSREPAMLSAFDTSPAIGLGGAGVAQTAAPISFPVASRDHLGHDKFHANTNGIACASCHPEGGDDARVWQFDFGARRTQELRGGVAETAPFHWSGDLPTMMHLVNEIFTHRMGGQAQPCDNISALSSWVNTLPVLPRATPSDPAAVERGRGIFFNPQTQCSTCHTPPQYSNNGTFVVGTGRGNAEAFQVPRLLGLMDRAPFLHDGQAATLRDRFNPVIGGGDSHGRTSQLSSSDIDDLVAFLETL